MQTKNHKWKFPYRVTRGHLSKIPSFFGDTRKYLVIPFPPSARRKTRGEGDHSLHPYNMTCVLYMYLWLMRKWQFLPTLPTSFLKLFFKCSRADPYQISTGKNNDLEFLNNALYLSTQKMDQHYYVLLLDKSSSCVVTHKKA